MNRSMGGFRPGEAPPQNRADQLDALVLETVRGSTARLTFADLKKKVRQSLPLVRGELKSAVRRLIGRKDLTYTYQFGNSFLEASFDKPVRVSASIVLKPPACGYQPFPGDIVIDIKAGAAFGNGVHPTTRLCLQGLERRCHVNPEGVGGQTGAVLDIGTGSGVLLAAALKMGMMRGMGLDIDPCALVEARENLVLNNLSNRAEISGRSIDSVTGRFKIVVANLRLPTLTTYFSKMCGLLEKDGALVLSGIKCNEFDTLKKTVDAYHMQIRWRGQEHGWCALLLEKR